MGGGEGDRVHCAPTLPSPPGALNKTRAPRPRGDSPGRLSPAPRVTQLILYHSPEGREACPILQRSKQTQRQRVWEPRSQGWTRPLVPLLEDKPPKTFRRPQGPWSLSFLIHKMGAVTPTAWGWGGVRENRTGQCGSSQVAPAPPQAPAQALCCVTASTPSSPRPGSGECGLDWSAGCGLGLRGFKRQVVRGHREEARGRWLLAWPPGWGHPRGSPNPQTATPAHPHPGAGVRGKRDTLGAEKAVPVAWPQFPHR